MAQRGRKKGCTDDEARILRQQLYDEYDKLLLQEKESDPLRASYLTRGYFIDRLFDLHIASWSKSRIRRLLMYRYKQRV